MVGKNPARFLSMMVDWVYFRAKSRQFTRHFVAVSCVFIYIAGSPVIFIISKVLPAVADPERHLSEPPPLGQNETSRPW
jgi:hypothetical protein